MPGVQGVQEEEEMEDYRVINEEDRPFMQYFFQQVLELTRSLIVSVGVVLFVKFMSLNSFLKATNFILLCLCESHAFVIHTTSHGEVSVFKPLSFSMSVIIIIISL